MRRQLRAFIGGNVHGSCVGRARRRGNYVTLAAITLPVLFGFVALTIDTMRLESARMDLKQASDSIAHAALISLRNGDGTGKTKSIARRVGRTNSVAQKAARIRSRQIEFGFWDFDERDWTPTLQGYNSVRVRLSRDRYNPDGPLALLLLPFMGFEYIDVHTERASIAAMRTRDTIVVADATLSFINEMGDARKSALTLLDAMYERYLPGDQIGLVPFVGDARLMTPLTDVTEGYATVRAQWSGEGYETPPGYSCVPHGSETGRYRCTGTEWTGGRRGTRRKNTVFTLRHGLTWCSARGILERAGGQVWYQVNRSYGSHQAHWAPEMPHCAAGGGGTNQGIGIAVAMDELLVNGSSSSVKSIVLISDGQPWEPNRMYRRTFGGPEMGGRSVANFGRFQADLAEEEDVHIFSVSFNDKWGYQREQQSRYLSSLTTGMGEFYETPDASELPELLRRIAESIPIVMVQ